MATAAELLAAVTPFLVFALAGGRVPLPLTVMQILAIDLGTDTLPALALSREPAEPGLMARPPRARGQGVISGGMLARAWGFLGLISAALLVMAGFFLTIWRAGWTPGAPTGPGTTLNLMVYLPVLHGLFGTADLSPAQLATIAPFPFVVWGADEARRMLIRRYHAGRQAA